MPHHKNVKLLAIRPRYRCHKDFLKALKAKVLYPLYQNYSFLKDPLGEIYDIIPDREAEILFNPNVDSKLKISISAIVGKNGSGKSSLMELFYLAVYIISIKQKSLFFHKNPLIAEYEEDEFKEICSKVKLEIFFEIDRSFHCAVIDSTYTDTIKSHPNIRYYDILNEEKIDLENLFYSIVVNYSIYGLNDYKSRWLAKLFHKNDGYKTPLVINPFRTRGSINILSEVHLAQSRLLYNLKPDDDGIAPILSGKGIREIHFRFNREKIKKINDFLLSMVIEALEIQTKKNRLLMFKFIYQNILLDTDTYHPPKTRMENDLVDYVIKKVVKICMTYNDYRQTYYKPSGKNSVPGLVNFENYIRQLAEDPSHITLKLRQALNIYRFDTLKLDREQGVERSAGVIKMPIHIFASRIAKILKEFPDNDPLEFIPTAAFSPSVIMADGADFFTLSSGEQQFIHSLQSVLYHLINLNSVFLSTVEPKRPTFERVNIILDEIELYFHPEFQRIYVSELLAAIRSLPIPKIRALNIIFLTHSPFILSDIPRTNVLKLDNGVVSQELENTFAGNIHSMLSESFFMNSTVGEFARKQCEELILFHSNVMIAGENELRDLRKEYSRKVERFRFIVKNIGEDYLKAILGNNLAFIENKLQPDNEELRSSLLRARNEIDNNLRNLGYDPDQLSSE